MTYEEILRENEALRAEVKRLKAICYAEIRDTIDEFYVGSLKEQERPKRLLPAWAVLAVYCLVCGLGAMILTASFVGLSGLISGAIQ